MNFLITGVNGFIGRSLASELVRLGHNVWGTSRSSVQEELIRRGVREVNFDSGFLSLLENSSEHSKPSLPEFDVVFHLAANARMNSRSDFMADNLGVTTLLIKSLESLDSPPRLLFVSSIAACDYPRWFPRPPFNERQKCCPRSSYGWSKLYSERHVMSYRGGYQLVRLAPVVGPEMDPTSHVRFLANASKKSMFVGGLLSLLGGTLPLVALEDCISALLFIAMLDQGSSTWNVLSSHLSIGEVVSCLNGRKSVFSGSLKVPRPLASPLPLQVGAAISDLLRFDNSKLIQAGWRPTIDIRSFLSNLEFL